MKMKNKTTTKKQQCFIDDVLLNQVLVTVSSYRCIPAAKLPKLLQVSGHPPTLRDLQYQKIVQAKTLATLA